MHVQYPTLCFLTQFTGWVHHSGRFSTLMSMCMQILVNPAIVVVHLHANSSCPFAYLTTTIPLSSSDHHHTPLIN